MAAASGNITLTPGVAVQVTESTCTKFRAQILSNALVRFMAAPNTTAPSTFEGGVYLDGLYDLIPASLSLADLFPHVASPVHVFALSDAAATVSYSHD